MLIAPAAARFQPWLFTLLWAVMASAMLVETDAYRYAALALVCFTLIRCRRDLRLVARDWLALLCWLWAAYALIRFLVGVLVYDESGTSEWLYVFPLLFPGLGVALYRTRGRIFPAASLLVALGLAGLLMTIDWGSFARGERVFPLFHNNPIHAAIACGMLLITSICWMLHARESGRCFGWKAVVIPATGWAAVVLSLLGILGAQSKGVWLALLPVVALMVLFLLFPLSRSRLVILVMTAFVAGAAAFAAKDQVLLVAGPTVEATGRLSERMLAHDGLLEAMDSTIKDPETPASMRDRLKLWANSLHVVWSAPWVGWGNLWQREWLQGPYPDVAHRLLHNGYLEILVRHGALGALMLGTFVVVSARRIYRAKTTGVIPVSVILYLYSLSLFFFITIASNSNNRLAIGESFFLLAAAAVFAISLAIRKSAETAAGAVA
nr:O-antigen ligase domain-containing protein [Rhizobium sp. Q54]